MDINYFIKEFRHVEKLNKTNNKYIEYSKQLKKYIYSGDKNSNSEILNKLSFKSSCIPYILSKIFSNDKKEIILILDRLNYALLNNFYSFENIVNYLVNILSNTTTKNQFMNTLKNKDLFEETIFKILLNKRFETYSKFEVNNKNIVENIFYKIFEKENHTNIFIKSLKFKKYDLYNSNNIFLNEKDIFYKNLTIILIEVFSKNHGFNIHKLDTNSISYNIYRLIFNLIKYNYNDLLDEVKFISNSFDIDNIVSNRRINNINSIVNDINLIEYNKNFFETSLLWLSKIERPNEDNETFLQIFYYYYNFNINNVIISKYIYILISNIFDYKITKNYHLIIDYYFLLNKLLNKEENKRFSKHYFYISKAICKIFENFSLVYDKIKNDNYLLFDYVLEICCILNNTLLNFNNYRRLYNVKLNNNLFYFKKFCCVYLENIIYNIENLVDIINNEKSFYIKYYYNSIVIMFICLKNLTKYYKNVIFCKELQDLFSRVLEHFTSKIGCLDYNKINKVNDNLDIINIYVCIKDIVLNLNNINLLNNVDFSDLKIKLLEQNKISITQLVFFNNTIKRKCIIYDDYYCDPITCNLIKEPIMIPENIIVDKNMIFRYLLTNNENPFNRLKLNMKILKEYNSKKCVRKKVIEFETKLINYKKEVNIVDDI
jgi:hypothetical protein